MDVARAQLVGAWRVTAYDDRASTDVAWASSYGDDVDGLIIYHETGWLTVSVSGDGRFDSYFGHFDVLEASRDGDSVVGRVNHELVESSVPELLTLDQSRPFRVTATTLVLGDEQTWRRVCERLSGPPGA
jgi:hypothetical protein